MTRCPNCGFEFRCPVHVAAGRVRARTATRCRCGAIIADSQELCARCAELEVLRERAKQAEKGGAS